MRETGIRVIEMVLQLCFQVNGMNVILKYMIDMGKLIANTHGAPKHLCNIK